MTTAELKKLWEPAAQGEIKRWSQVRPGWPDQEIHLFGPGTVHVAHTDDEHVSVAELERAVDAYVRLAKAAVERLAD